MVNNVASCSSGGAISGGSPTCAATLGTSSDKVIVTNPFGSLSGNLNSGSTISITINTVRNPPTLKPYSTFEIQTTDIDLNPIETCSGLKLTLTTVGTLPTDTIIRIINN